MKDPRRFAQALTNDFVIENGRLEMPFETLHEWHDRVLAFPVRERRALAVELLAVASMFHREGGRDAEPAILQLGELAAVALQSGEEARELFSKSGLDLKAAADRLGVETHARPVSSSPEPGSVSLLALRLSKMSTE